MKSPKGRKRKKFLPYFRPQYVEVFGFDEDIGLIRLPIVKPVEYTAASIRVYVNVK